MDRHVVGARQDGSRQSWLLVAAVISLALSLTPWGRWALYPFKLFTTWVHECGHALAALLVGGAVHSITLEPDTSGLTSSLLPDSMLAQAVVTGAGYLGAALFGCVLLAATRLHRFSHAVVYLLGGLMLVTVPLWMRNLFGIGSVLVLGLGLVALGKHLRGAVANFLLSLLAIQVALNALFDIRVLFSLEDGQKSDAVRMEQLMALPDWLWAGLWMVVSVLMMACTLWLTRERAPKAVR